MSRQPYDTPQLIRHDRTVNSHFGEDQRNRPMTEIDGISVDELMNTYGSPLFVFSERTLRNRAATVREAFKSAYPRVRFAWSYKTNSLDAICAILHQEGWHAEVVSELEYDMARRLGMPGRKIIYNGAYKPKKSLIRAADEGAMVQIDHLDELDVLEELASERGKIWPIAIRMNMSVKAIDVKWDRFGLSLDTGEAWTAATRIAAHPFLKLVGLHCHLGTQILVPDAYRESAARLAGFARNFEDATGGKIEYLDMGGGFPSQNDLFTQFGIAADHVPDITLYAEAIGTAIRQVYQGRAILPELVLEMGRALVDESGILLSTVVGSRRTVTGGRGIVLDAGVNLLYTAYWYRNAIVPTRRINGRPELTSVYGPLCMAIDVVRLSIPLPPLQYGNRVAIFPAGAYNVTQWMQFSQTRPNVVLIGDDGKVDVIRRAETCDYIKDVEQLPERLRIVTAEILSGDSSSPESSQN